MRLDLEKGVLGALLRVSREQGLRESGDQHAECFEGGLFASGWATVQRDASIAAVEQMPPVPVTLRWCRASFAPVQIGCSSAHNLDRWISLAFFGLSQRRQHGRAVPIGLHHTDQAQWAGGCASMCGTCCPGALQGLQHEWWAGRLG